MFSTNSTHLKESLWLLSNLAASGAAPSKIIISNSVIQRVLTLANSYNIDVQHEALWVLSTLVSSCEKKDAYTLFTLDDHVLIPLFLKGLKVRDSKLVQNILHSLKDLLKLDEHFQIQGMSNSVYRAL